MKTYTRTFGAIAIIIAVIPIFAVDYWWIRIFDFPQLQLTLLSLLCLLFYLFKFNIKNKIDYLFVVAMIAGLLYQAKKIYPFTTLAPVAVANSKETAANNSFKLYTANVLQKNDKHELLISEIERENPDIVLLMETDLTWKEAIHGTLIKTFQYTVLQPQDNTYGMLLYSKYPLIDPEVLFIVDERIPSITTKIAYQNDTIFQLIALHPTPPMPQHNPSSSDRDKEMMTTAFKVKDAQIPTIVAGDFNDVAWSRTTTLFKKVSQLLDPRVGRGFFNTFNAKDYVMRWPLDHLFVSEHFRMQDLRTGTDIASDHFAAIATMTYEPKRASDQMPEPATQEQINAAKKQMESPD